MHARQFRIDVTETCASDRVMETHGVSPAELKAQNHQFKGTGGVSEENRCIGFRPAFLDEKTGNIYLSCFTNGQIAPFHLLDGLPQDLVVSRTETGRVKCVKNTVAVGFVLGDRFYTREQAAEAIAQR